MYILTPVLPAAPAATEFWTCLAARPLANELAAYLRGHWLPTLALDQTRLEVPSLARPEYLRLHVFGRVLLDLAGQGWHFEAVAPVLPGGPPRLGATPPDTAEWKNRPASQAPRPALSEIKKQLQQALVAHRDEQLAEPAVQRFIRRLERPRRHQGRLVSVRSLLADPKLLAADLQTALAAPTPELRDERVLNLVQPYLQSATADAVDDYTGLPLLDIWRYCRHTWSLPFQTQPGRRMFYLVRDRARVGHPIMGIGALGSSVVQLTVRDEYIGWTWEALRDCPDPAPRLRALTTELDRAIGEIYCLDFLAEGVLTEADLTTPSPAALARLSTAAQQLPLASREQQKQGLDLVAEAQTPLFRRKRAETLAGLLAA
ncbi:Druantia anti-phage system protein DruA [Hymenobacter aquaticus]|uniref:Druantia anti-phage system protein DruA n=1 Tax=Hymenobacter aquaticus TaxID=1867101 RepID=UPI001436AE91|nr:Druantia anti-phage system protein DruA [Hymenobacter aquaticus]